MRAYLDWNATAPPLPEALAAMRAAQDEAWGNPSSVHAHGRAARARVEDARAAIGELGGADPRDVLLTSGGTEANNLAVRAPFAAKAGGRLAVSRLEHPSILRVAEALARDGLATIAWVKALADGRVDLASLEEALAPGDVRLVCLQAVNPETGVVQPVAEAARLARQKGALFHVDAVQAWGRVAFDPTVADSVSVAAHKMRGPKGIGALVTRPGLSLSPVLVGGSQERGLRPGTVDGVMSAGFAVVARHARRSPARYAEEVLRLRDALEARILALAPGAAVNGTATRAPHVTNLSFPGRRGPELVAALDLEGVSASSGSACAAGTPEPSSVLRAMVGEERAAGALRLSLGETTTSAETELAAAAFATVLGRG